MKNTYSLSKQIIVPIILFAITMGMFESAVVVYLRELYYPGGFEFPLKLTSSAVAITEFLREFASLIMIGSVAWLGGRSFTQRFAWFLIIFAIWDIFYYVFLKAILSWPESFMTWDILFLIPVHWTGPVISPIIISLIMIFWGSALLHFTSKYHEARPVNGGEWWLLGGGALVVFFSFIMDYTLYLFKHYMKNSADSFIDKMEVLSMNYVPDTFYWPVFLAGVILLLVSALMYIKRQLAGQ